MILRPTAAALALSGGLLALLACSSRVPQPRATAQQPTSALLEVEYPPPPARVEFLPEQPSGNTVWVNGEWLWQGRRWAWRPGAWIVPPENAAYARRVIVRRADGKLFFAPGVWRDSQGREVQPPIAKASEPRSGSVVNPEGETEPTGTDVQADAGPDARAPARSGTEGDAAPPP
jgi:hypothetical protein